MSRVPLLEMAIWYRHAISRTPKLGCILGHVVLWTPYFCNAAENWNAQSPRYACVCEWVNAAVKWLWWSKRPRKVIYKCIIYHILGVVAPEKHSYLIFFGFLRLFWGILTLFLSVETEILYREQYYIQQKSQIHDIYVIFYSNWGL